MLGYFGEDWPEGGCGACDNCRSGQTAAQRASAIAASQDEDAAASGEFRIGDTVYHPKFGQGTVERFERDLVTVLFPSHGYKTLLAGAVSREEQQIA